MANVTLKAGALLALALILGACEEAPPPAPEPPLLIRKTASDEAGNAALATGKLILRSGCLTLERADRSLAVLLWPAEARVEHAAYGSVRVLGTPGKPQKTVQVGKEIVVGGGELGTTSDTALVGPGRAIEANAAFPAECAGAVWNVYSFEPAGAVGADTLQGKWVVARLNGAAYGPGDHRMSVTVEGDSFRVQSQCAPYWWTYASADGGFKTRKAAPPGPVCARARTNWEGAFEEAVDRAVSVEKRGEDLLIRGPGGQVLLSRP